MDSNPTGRGGGSRDFFSQPSSGELSLNRCTTNTGSHHNFDNFLTILTITIWSVDRPSANPARHGDISSNGAGKPQSRRGSSIKVYFASWFYIYYIIYIDKIQAYDRSFDNSLLAVPADPQQPSRHILPSSGQLNVKTMTKTYTKTKMLYKGKDKDKMSLWFHDKGRLSLPK